SPLVAGVLAPARWFGDVERWRIARVRGRAAGGRPRPEEVGASDPGLWLDLAHAVVVVPVVLITSVVTALWWFTSLATLTFPLRSQPTPGAQHPMILDLGSGTALSLRLGSPGLHVAFAITLG